MRFVAPEEPSMQLGVLAGATSPAHSSNPGGITTSASAFRSEGLMSVGTDAIRVPSLTFRSTPEQAVEGQPLSTPGVTRLIAVDPKDVEDVDDAGDVVDVSEAVDVGEAQAVSKRIRAVVTTALKIVPRGLMPSILIAFDRLVQTQRFGPTESMVCFPSMGFRHWHHRQLPSTPFCRSIDRRPDGPRNGYSVELECSDRHRGLHVS